MFLYHTYDTCFITNVYYMNTCFLTYTCFYNTHKIHVFYNTHAYFKIT